MENAYKFYMLEVSIIKTIFIANLKFNTQKQKEVQLGIRLENRIDFDDYGLKARLIQSFYTEMPEEQPMPFRLEIDLGVFFSFHQPVPILERGSLVSTWLPQAAFPYMREHVAETTRKGGFPPLLLNPMMFDDQTTPFRFAHIPSRWEH